MTPTWLLNTIYLQDLSKVVALAEHKTVLSMLTAEAALSTVGTEGCLCSPWMAAKGCCASKQYCIIVYSSQTMMQWRGSQATVIWVQLTTMRTSFWAMRKVSQHDWCFCS